MGEVLGNAGGAASSPLTTKARPIYHFILLELSFKEKQIILESCLLCFGSCTPSLEGPPLRDGWLHMHVTGSMAMQSSIRLSVPQHLNSPGSPKQCQDSSTWQMRAQEHSLAIVTLPNLSLEQRDAGSSCCGTLELHCRAWQSGRGLLFHIRHLLVCFAILCSSWLRSQTPTCSPKALLGLSKQTTGRDKNKERKGRRGGKREENQNLIKDTFASGPQKIYKFINHLVNAPSSCYARLPTSPTRRAIKHEHRARQLPPSTSTLPHQATLSSLSSP